MSVQRPAARSVHIIWGKVKSRRERRPKVSMVQKAGKANSQLTRPKPKEARRAWNSLEPFSLKTVAL
jgi:hypothetical protein